MSLSNEQNNNNTGTGNNALNSRRGEGYSFGGGGNNPNNQGNGGNGGNGGAPNRGGGWNLMGKQGYSEWNLKEFLRKIRDLAMLIALCSAFAVAAGHNNKELLELLRNVIM